jgi:hypothetical protein
MKILTEKEMLSEVVPNQLVIDRFINDTFPKDRRGVFGSRHLTIEKVENGWALKNYTTFLAYRPDGQDVIYFVSRAKWQRSITTTKIQNDISRALSISGIKFEEVTPEELNNIMDAGGRGIEEPLIGSGDIFENKLVKDFLMTEGKALLTEEKTEPQALKDLFGKIVSYTGFPTVVNSKNMLKATIYLLDKWVSYIDNKDVSAPETWENGKNKDKEKPVDTELEKEEPAPTDKSEMEQIFPKEEQVKESVQIKESWIPKNYK